MKRRAAIVVIALLAATAGGAMAQSGKIPRVGVLHAGSAKEPASAQREPFERGLRELGWAPGSSVLVDYRYAEGSTAKLAEQAADLVRAGVDVIVARGAVVIEAARQTTATNGRARRRARSDQPGRFDALLVRGDPQVIDPNRSDIVTMAAKLRLPAIYPWRFFAEAGGLISYGSSLPGFHHRSATYVSRILKGAKAGDLAIEQPTTFELVVNLKAAKTLGIELPKALLFRADELIQ